jgi:hypothetical protein
VEEAAMINVVIFTHAFDTGGQGYRLKRAFDRHYYHEFNVRSIHSAETYFHFTIDLRNDVSNTFKLFRSADILHMRNEIDSLAKYAKGRERDSYGLIFHHHGSRFRSEHEQIAVQARRAGAFQIASTLDLTLLEPDVAWLPSPQDIAELEEISLAASGGPAYPNRPLRVAHAPTDRKIKSTQVVLDAILELNRRGIPAVLDLIERQPHLVTLDRKAKADIYVDQFKLGIGNNALEAFGMRIPVIAGVSDPAVREAMIDRWGGLPFYESTEDTLVTRLEELATDHRLRAHWAELGHRYLLQFHDERIVADLLASYYRLALADRKVVI